MPIRTQSDLPVRSILEKENIFVMDEDRAMHQDIRPLRVVLLTTTSPWLKSTLLTRTALTM